MRVLIELHDTVQPVDNVVTACVLKPDVLVLLGNRKIQKEKYIKPLLNFFNMQGLQVKLETRICRLHDVIQVEECLCEVIEAYGAENCIVDVGGGSDVLLLAAGHVCREKNLTAVRHVPGANKIRWFIGPEAGREENFDLQLSMEQVVALSGGELLRNGHVGPELMNKEMASLIERIFPVYLQNKKAWPKFVQYLQVAAKKDYETNDGWDAPRMIFVNGQTRMPNSGIMRQLAEIGAVTMFEMDDRRCRFAFANPTIAKCMCDVGVWLEMYIFSAMVQSGLFDAVQISMVVSWDDDEKNDKVQNEIDVAACAGLGQVFCSCKTSSPDPYMLNEIAVMSQRFGTAYATPVLACVCDVEKESAGVYWRAKQMGIEIIDINDLNKENLLKRLTTLRRKWDR